MFKKNKLIAEGPKEDHIQTEDERQIKCLVEQQTATKVTFNEQLARGREFSKSGSYNVDVKTSGATSLDEYNIALRKVEYLEELKACGLTDEEINLKLSNSNGRGEKRKGLENPEVTFQKLAKIDLKINMKKKDLQKTNVFRNSKKLSRHRFELERSLANTQEKAKLYDILLEQSKLMEDEGGCLKQTIEKVENKVQGYLINKRKERKNKFKDIQLDDSNNDLGDVYPHNKWEKVENKFIGPPPKPENWQDTIDIIPSDSIARYKLTENEIRLIPRFKDYNPGEKNNILFVKNLSSKITEEDLHMLFNRFNKDEAIECRLLKGKMRGQAFITFPCSDEATEALKLINGYEYKGKPIVIMYGKKMKNAISTH
ncbi:DgyrCDS4815 [Dimorphilus gyrociliatus]|uniref:DgyrCDS4815 n=1 Tax=Dimorphilus gyrociliatus TaxID=2664684 RepID=A0A7I8VI29_9ANNE|nr:DgyrCDS4815 [Dimorphilus gyrociliatus]